MEPPKRVMVNVPAVLAIILRQRMVELKFSSSSAYFLSLLVFDLYARRPHLLTGSIQSDSPETRDAFFEGIARDFDDLQSKPPGWFEHRLEELARQQSAEILARLEEEKWQLHADNRELKDRVRELEQELARRANPELL